MPLGRDGALARRAVGFRARRLERARDVVLVARLNAVEVGRALEVAFGVEGRARVLTATGFALRARARGPSLSGDELRAVSNALTERIDDCARAVGVVAESVAVGTSGVHGACDAIVRGITPSHVPNSGLILDAREQVPLIACGQLVNVVPLTSIGIRNRGEVVI